MPPKKQAAASPAAPTPCTSTATPGLVLSNRWRLGSLLGEGACGQVFAVEDVTDAQNEHAWVMKLSPLPPRPPPGVARKKNKTNDAMKRNADTLYMEQLIYKNYLMNVPNVPVLPNLLSYGEDKGFRFLVMQRLGQDLTQLFRSKNYKFSLATIADLGKQMLEGIRRLHERQLLFIDVKPENFMLGQQGTSEASKVFLVDFGLVEKYTASSGAHKPQDGAGAAGGGVGTPLFSSLACHEGRPAGRRDDLEALGWVLVFFLRGGDLPWAGAKNDAECLKMKREAKVDVLLKGREGGKEVGRVVEMARETSFEAVPDYAAFEKVLVGLGKVKEAGNNGRAAGAGAGEGGGEMKKGGRKRKSAVAMAGEGKGEGGEGGGGEVIVLSPDDPAGRADNRGDSKTAAVNAAAAIEEEERGGSPGERLLNKGNALLKGLGGAATSSNSKSSSSSRNNKSNNSSGGAQATEKMETTTKKMKTQRVAEKGTPNVIGNDDNEEGGRGGGEEEEEEDNQSVASMASEMKALSLEVLEGPHKGQTFHLGGLEKVMYIGREGGLGVVLSKDGGVGGRHVKLKASGRDSVHSLKVMPVVGTGLGPVMVNKVEVGRNGRVLFAGDLLQVGGSTLVLRRG